MTRTRSQTGRWKRNKGRAFEQQVARALQAVYPEARRNVAQTRGAKREGGDILGTPYHVEVKAHAKVSLVAAHAQARADAGPNAPVLVVAKSDRRQPVVYGLALDVLDCESEHRLAYVSVDLAEWIACVAIAQRHAIARSATWRDPTEAP